MIEKDIFMAKRIVAQATWIAHDFVPETFGRLTTVSSIYKPAGCKQALQDFVCICGNKLTRPRSYVKHGNTTSCGCARIENAVKNGKNSIKHGYFGTPTYKSWSAMILRCEDPTHVAYHNYGGRGIKIHPDMRDFAGFLEHMGTRPSLDHSIDRINNDGNYEPGNCRWATRKEQAVNKRNSLVITYNGESGDIHFWANKTGIQESALRSRLSSGWSFEEVMGEKERPVYNKKWIEYDGRCLSISEWSKETGVTESAITRRLRDGLPLDKVFLTDNARYRYLEVFGERLSLQECCKRYGITPTALRHRLDRNWPVELALTLPKNKKRPKGPSVCK